MELRERIAGERRRLRKVREALSAAVAQTSQGDEAYIPFYLAIADYFEAAMERLHTQDVRMGDLLREKADMDDAENQKILSELDRRLAGNQEHLKEFLAGGKALQEQGEKALEQYEAAAQAYTNYIICKKHSGKKITPIPGSGIIEVVTVFIVATSFPIGLVLHDTNAQPFKYV